MPRRKEISWNPLAQSDSDDRGDTGGRLENRTARGTVAHSEPRPVTPIQALMECAPGDEPERSLEELAPLREILNSAIERTLDDRERWIFDAIFCRKLSLRELGSELSLSKSFLARERDRIREKLIVVLLTEYPDVKEFLHG